MEYKDIDGYEGLYQISKCGQIKSLARIVTYQLNGKEVNSRRPSRIMKPGLSSNKTGGSYLQTILTDKLGVKKAGRIHRLVALTYVPNPLDLPLVDHIDRDKLNNHADNLRWVTHAENIETSKAPKQTAAPKTKVLDPIYDVDLVHPDHGTHRYYRGFHNEWNLRVGAVRRMIRGERKSTKGWGLA